MKTITYEGKTYEVETIKKITSCSLCDLKKVCMKGFLTMADMPCIDLEVGEYLKEVKE